MPASLLQSDRRLLPTPLNPNRQPWRKGLGIVLLHLGCVFSLPLLVTPAAWSAEKISLYVGPLEFSLAVESLELYASEGKIKPDFATYASRLTEEQLAQLQQILVTRADVTPVAIAQFLYSQQGELILREIGELIQTRTGQSGFYAIRSALILAAADEQGLTPLNVLKKFPTSSIRINSDRAFELIGRVSQTIGDTERAIAAIEKAAIAEAGEINAANFPLDLRQRGTVQFSKQTLTLNDLTRNRTFPADLYLPQQSGRAPLIIISHGLGSNRESYQYLATHLASHGFAVAVPEHPGSNAEQLQALASGLVKNITPPRELIDRPLDIKFLLDELERNYGQQLEWRRVGVIGQSFGAYTALALAGAEINFEQLQSNCDPDDPDFNISFLIQCQALQLPRENYNLRDERVAAAIAINPLSSGIFGAAQLSRIAIPVAIVSGSADAVTPALDEQILPFTALTTPEKYLVLLEQGTHFSTVGVTSQDLPMPEQVLGPDPAIAYAYTNAIALAFFGTYIAGDSQYQPYLSAAYAQILSRHEMPLSLVRALTLEQLQ
jgi:predicted dienelactone hydrolase